MNLQPVTLTGRHVRLEPLSQQHHGALASIGLEPSLWKWTTIQLTNAGDVRGYIDSALQAQSARTALPFATVDLESGCVAGSTRFMNIDETHRHVEIGNTWIAPRWQRTVLNTEAKYLMLRHAFEQLACIRVEFKTDCFNQQSRTAILRLGAQQEGIFRNHMLCWNGRVRDSVWFSITDAEWPAVKQRLEEKLCYER